MSYIPCIEIYFSEKTQVFLLIHNAKDPEFGFGTAFGEIQRVAKEEMERGGLQIVLESIAKAPSRVKSDMAEIEKLSRKEQKALNDSHLLILISLQKNGHELRLGAMKYHAGKHSDLKKPNFISLPTDQKSFFQALELALSQLR